MTDEQLQAARRERAPLGAGRQQPARLPGAARRGGNSGNLSRASGEGREEAEGE
jgi:hypothetical protein